MSKVSTGVLDCPPKIMVTGDPGVGKSSFAAQFDSPLFIEPAGVQRTKHLDVARIEVSTWEETLGVIAEVLQSQSYKTLVFDPITEIEGLVLDFITREAGVSHYQDIGGGWFRFRAALVNQWKRFIRGLEKLTKNGIQPILIGHTKVKTYSPPDGQPYDRYILKFEDDSSSAFLTENMDLVGFAKFETFVRKGDDKKAKANTTSERNIYWKFHPAYPSKMGIKCSEVTKLDYEDFKKGL